MNESVSPLSLAMEDVPCMLCGSTDVRVRFISKPVTPSELVDHFRAATDVYGAFGRIVECRKCGLNFTSPRPSATSLLTQYAGSEDGDYLGEDTSRSINAYFSLHTLKQFASAGRLLDVGCSTGYFLNAARVNFETVGVEPGQWAAEFARKQLGLDVIDGTLESTKFPDEHFDVVSMSDVIEHVTDPLATLREAARVTKPGGLLYLVTPNIGSITARLMGSHWWGLRPAHIYYFSDPTLRQLLEQAGFDVVLMRSYGRVFTCGYWQSRLRHYSAFVNRVLNWIIRTLGISRKLTYLNTMDSLECCARKRAAPNRP